ncbi:MAG TPA: carboxylesterase family protein [Paraburkholderia sp.]|nr:carboxylesterase family protein [Paraburkholderia sp.]
MGNASRNAHSRHASVKWIACMGVASSIALLAGCSGDSLTADPTTTVIESGALQGAATDGVLSFKGIPYAAAPVGMLRWRPPQAVAAWHGTRPATTLGHDCMQKSIAADAAPIRTTPSEDCLVLNVWRPASAPAQAAKTPKLPVMVWIHGGGYVSGGASPAVYDGSQFAKQGVVFVSFNYRLGRFGFFAHPALTAEQPTALLGNYAYMDQLAALKWVQRNIAAFGGDADNVTLIGESAGGESIHSIITAPLAKGLFQRAIVESGGGRMNQARNRYLSTNAKAVGATGEEIGVAFARSAGISGDGVSALAALRALPAGQVVGDLSLATLMTSEAATYSGGPMIEGKLVVDEPGKLFEQGQYNHVALLVGSNDADLGMPAPVASKDAAYAIFGAKNLAAARAAFDPSGTASVTDVANQIARVQYMIEPARFVARALSARRDAVYLYRFSYVAQSLRAQFSGAMHASEIPYVFDTLGATYGTAASSEDEQVAQTLHAYWVAFAKTGNPNGAGRTAWPLYEVDTDPLMAFTAAGAAAVQRPDPIKAQLDLVSPVSDALLND